MTERYDNLLIRQRLCREALAGPLGYWERAECLETLERIEREIAELDSPAFTPGTKRCQCIEGFLTGEEHHESWCPAVDRELRRAPRT